MDHTDDYPVLSFLVVIRNRRGELSYEFLEQYSIICAGGNKLKIYTYLYPGQIVSDDPEWAVMIDLTLECEEPIYG